MGWFAQEHAELEHLEQQLRLLQDEEHLRREQESQVQGWLTNLDFLGDELAARGYGVSDSASTHYTMNA